MRSRVIAIRNILIITVTLFIILSLYLTFIFLPTKGRTYIVTALEKNINRPVSLGTIYYNPFQGGIVLKNLVIYEYDMPFKEEFVKIKKLSFSPIIIPTFKKINFIIPFIHISDPHINISEDESKKFNFLNPYLLKKQSVKNSAVSAVIYNIKITNGTINFTDKSKSETFHKTLKNIDANITLALPSSLKIKSSLIIEGAAKTKLDITSKYNFVAKFFESKMKIANLDPREFEAYYKDSLKVLIKKAFIDAELLFNIDKEKLLSLGGKVFIREGNFTSNTLDIKGDIDSVLELKSYLSKIADAEFSASSTLKNISIKNLPYPGDIDNINGPLKITNKDISSPGLWCSIFNNKIFITGSFTDFKNPYISISGSADTLNLATCKNFLPLELRKNFKGTNLSGIAKTNFTYSGNIPLPETTKFSVSAELKNAAITGLSYPEGAINEINGPLKITESGVSSTGISINFADNFIFIKGHMDDFKDPLLSVEASSKAFDISDFKLLLPAKFKKISQNLEPSGTTSFKIGLEKKLKDKDLIQLDGNLNFKDIALKNLKPAVELKNIKGDISFKKDEIILNKINFIWKDRPYLLDSKLTGFEAPDISLKLEGKDLSLKADLNIKNNDAHIGNSVFKFRSSNLSVLGDIYNIKEPLLNIYIKGAVNIEDIGLFYPKFSETAGKLSLKGILDINSIVNGPLKDPLSMEIGLKATSDNLSIWKLNGNNFYLDLRMKNKIIEVPQLSLNPYDGTLFAVFMMDLAQANKPYTIDATIEKVDVNKLIMDTDLKDKRISGELSSKIALSGKANDLGALTGSGWIHIAKGYLWEVPVMRGIGEALLLRGFQRIIFDEVGGNFEVGDKMVSTRDLKLWSNEAVLTAVGNINFNGGLDFDVSTSITEGLVDENQSDWQKLSSDFLKEAGQVIGNLQISGTIQKPEFKIKPKVGKYLKDKIKDFIKGALE